MDLSTAARLASRIVTELAPFCDQLEVAGSIRRCRPTCRNIDLVALVRDKAGFRERLLRSTTVVSESPTSQVVRLTNGVQIDIFWAVPPLADLFGLRVPGNWTSLLIWRTGSRHLNTYLAQRALAAHLNWDPLKGLYSAGTASFVNTPTEAEFFHRLDLEFIPPDQRERAAADLLFADAEMQPAA